MSRSNQQNSGGHRPKTAVAVLLGYESALEALFNLSSESLQRKRPRPSDPNRPAPAKADLLRAEAQLGALLAQPPRTPLHLVTGARRCRPANGWRIHRCSQRLIGASELIVAEHLRIASAPAAFVQMGSRLPFAQLIELGYALCGTYRSSTPSTPTAYDQPPLTSTTQIASFIRANPHLPGARQAKRALEHIADNAASPREAKAAILLALPMRYGGYGLGAPLMNHEVTAAADARSIAGRGCFRCDLFWKQGRLDVEYQSREFHSNEQSRVGDSRRTNALRSMGYSVLSITNDELDSLAAMDVIAATIARCCGKQFRVSVDRYRERQVALRKQLRLPIEPCFDA